MGCVGMLWMNGKVGWWQLFNDILRFSYFIPRHKPNTHVLYFHGREIRTKRRPHHKFEDHFLIRLKNVEDMMTPPAIVAGH